MLVLTPTTVKNIDNIKTALKSSNAVLIQGEVGCGKSLTVDYLSDLLGCKETLIQVDVDDSFDSKDLLGKFSATETPGTFEWIPGPLTLAVEKGYWVLMEDIDLASFDVFSVLLRLLENSTLFISDKNRVITAHPNFKLIATQQIVEFGDAFFSKKNSIPYLELWGCVIMNRIPPNERCEIVHHLYPKVPLSVLENLTNLSENSPNPNVINLRTLLRWGKRVNQRLSNAYDTMSTNSSFLASGLREMMLKEAFDCFVAKFPVGTEQESMLMLIADACGVPVNVAETLIMTSKPQQSVGASSCTFGRVNLPMYSLSRISRQSRIAFAETCQAMSLLERLAACVETKEHVLLTGETGVGKTFVVQYLADQLGQNLIVHNLNQQTDTSDFMGGWKPLDVGVSMRALFDDFSELFGKCFNIEKNAEFLNSIQNAFSSRNWEKTAKLILKGCFSAAQKQASGGDIAHLWDEVKAKAEGILTIIMQTKSNMAFFFEEGSLIKAWREGHWILLDELNLATTEVLERVSSVLGDIDKIFLTDKGSGEGIPRHKNFHVFANMNPPTDVGKKDLPPSLRSRFTEVFVSEPFNASDINIVVREYIGFLTPDAKINEITEFFLDCVANAKSKLCALDGESKPPSFSMRTLTRALAYVRKATPLYGFRVSLFDGLMLGFATPLQRQFHKVVEGLIVKNIFGGKQPSPPKLPTAPIEGNFVAYQHIWIQAGTQDPFKDDSFILTNSVRGHLTNLSRAVFAQRPVLLEGPTSSGKSSMVKYLAELTGNTFVRINNHESTEVQEYLGHYVTDEFGKLRFVDGILVRAVRNGYWVVLDELNLAPTDVLEALNRLLDDNCELFIPDTQETIRPHPGLRIFATQNPAGIYGGRKMLSRAFRNRFLEITVDEIPTEEIVSILLQRYSMPEGFAVKIVEVMTNLQLRRQSSQIFAGRHGFITPRDLFRWAERHPSTYQELAEHGFLLLGERCRKPGERQIVKDVIETITKTEISEMELYKPSHWPFVDQYFKKIEEGIIDEFKIVWTQSMQRLFTVVGICLEHFEPVLLVGETGSSKTTVCQLWAALLGLPLRIVNCHQHTEAADFLGSLRPVPPDRRESALFEWRDGPLVETMRDGGVFVLDEISLTEDSVLERLNSVLEPSRSITLAEKSSGETFTAHQSFRILGTMNPGGDFGKKELSPALRNRFTEIYVRPTSEEEEVATILSKRLVPGLTSWALPMARVLCGLSVAMPSSGAPTHISIRDIVTWVEFMNAVHGRCSEEDAFVHGLDALLLDGIGVGSGQLESTTGVMKKICIEQAEKALGGKPLSIDSKPFWEVVSDMAVPQLPPELQQRFFFGATTTQRNLSKLMRCTVMRKAVLLEGSPGVGKTSIVESLGAALDIRVMRINLSEQTDMMDLLGTFLPQPTAEENEEVEKGPRFAWSDGVLLQALKEGCWVILDELNLASQSVLEGLNALLDHRAAVFVPELNQSFEAHPHFRIFACQNPLVEGGGRKGLPRSFLNRFVKVRVEGFTREDLIVITQAVCRDVAPSVLSSMVDFVAALQKETMEKRSFGLRGSPWEFNLRDVLRWAGLMKRYDELGNPLPFAEVLFVQRFRAGEDRERCRRLLYQCFQGAPLHKCVDESVSEAHGSDFLVVDNAVVYRGRKLITRGETFGSCVVEEESGFGLAPTAAVDEGSTLCHGNRPLLMLPSQADVIASILMCAAHEQFALLVGSSGSGKSFALRTAAALAGAKLVTFSINASCDTIDLLGGFDQVEGRQGEFEWRDSLIIEAMLQGHWLVLDNVNYCNASVLDRLNPLVEPNGKLFVNEQGLVRGEVRVVRPHPQFRLFATLNPRYGEISRAMRNRAIELFLSPVGVPTNESNALCCSAVFSSPQGNCTWGATLPSFEAFSPLLRFEIAAGSGLAHLSAFHHQFVQRAFHADTTAVLSASLVDATAAGSPNIFTLLRASHIFMQHCKELGEEVEMKMSSALEMAGLHCYLENRVGSWLHQKESLSEVLQHHVSQLSLKTQPSVKKEDDEEKPTCESPSAASFSSVPHLSDILQAFMLGSPLQASDSGAALPSSKWLSHRLLMNRVLRSGLALSALVSYLHTLPSMSPDMSAWLNYSLFTFIMEQPTDGAVVESLSSERRNFLGHIELPEKLYMRAESLLLPSYSTSSALPALFCRALIYLGPHATILEAAMASAGGRGNEQLGGAGGLSDSLAVNSAAFQLVRQLVSLVKTLDEPGVLQRVLRAAVPFLTALGIGSSVSGTVGATKLSATQFVPMVTKTLLLLELSSDHPIIRTPTIALLEAIRRHLDLSFSLTGEERLLQSIAFPVHITTREEQEVVEQVRRLQIQSRAAQLERIASRTAVKSASDVLMPVWRVAAFRSEFSLLQSLIRLVTPRPDEVRGTANAEDLSGSLVGASYLAQSVGAFIREFTQAMPLFTALDLTLWNSVQSALAPPSAAGEIEAQKEAMLMAVRSYLPLLVSSLFQRFDLNEVMHVGFGAWCAGATRCLRFAGDVPVGVVGVPRNEHEEAMAGMNRFLSECPTAPRDPFELWKRNMQQELVLILLECLPFRLRGLCMEAFSSSECFYGPLLSQALAALEAAHSDDSGNTSVPLPVTERQLLSQLLNALRCLTSSEKEEQEVITISMRAVALLCALKCRLLLPPNPIDPMFRKSLHKELSQLELKSLVDLSKNSEWVADMSQRDPFPHLAILSRLRSEEEEREREAGEGLVERPDTSGNRYAQLTRELHQMVHTFLSDERLQSVTTTEANVNAEKVQSWGELLFEETMNILGRYGGYEDATLHVAQAALFAAVSSRGIPLECRLHSASPPSSLSLDWSNTISQMQFPSVSHGALTVPSFSGRHRLSRTLRYLDACLTLLQGAVPGTLDRRFVSEIFLSFRTLYRHVEELNEKEREAEKLAVKYKEKSLLIEGDDEKMLSKLRDMFPSYEKEFLADDEEKEGEEEDDDEERLGHQSKIIFSEKDGSFVRRLASTYTEFYHGAAAGKVSRNGFSLDHHLQSFKSRFDVLSAELTEALRQPGGQGSALFSAGFTEEEECLLFHGFSARTALLKKDYSAASSSVTEKNLSGFNIFTDPEPFEVKQFSVPLKRLQQRVNELLETYPENVSLLGCRRLAKKVSELSALRTPLMKVMSGCEVLLRQCYEWERNASTAVSLMAPMTELSGFVLRWRRLELHCWSHVFKAKKEEFELNAALQWFELYDITHGEGEEGAEEDELAQCLRLFQRLSTFLWGAALGDFSARLKIARGMAFELMNRYGVNHPLTNVALHISDFFSPFEPFIAAKCAAAVAPLEDDMDAFCQIMRWEDANYYAVRATVEKSYLKVARVLSALESALRVPILPLIVADEERCEEDPAMGFPLPVDVSKKEEKSRKEKKEAKAALEKGTAGKRRRNGKAVAQVPPERVLPSEAPLALWEPVGKAVESFTEGADEIISRVSQLQAPKTPQQVKIRALKSMFERLGAWGVPCTHELQVEPWELLYSSTEALLGCRTMYGHQCVADQLSEVSAEQYRLCRWVQRMREAERHPHADLSGAQAKRATGTVESLLSQLIHHSRWVFQLFQLRESLAAIAALAQLAIRPKSDAREDSTSKSESAVSSEFLDRGLQLAASLHQMVASLRWMEQERVGSSSASTEDRSLLIEFHSESERLWNLMEEREVLRGATPLLPLAAVQPLLSQYERLVGVCGRLRCHSDAVVRAAAALCSRRVGEELEFLSTHSAGVMEEMADAQPRLRLRLEKQATPVEVAAESAVSSTALLEGLARLTALLTVSPPITQGVSVFEKASPVTEPADSVNDADAADDPEKDVYTHYVEHLRNMWLETGEVTSLTEKCLGGASGASSLWFLSIAEPEARDAHRQLLRGMSVVDEAKRMAVSSLQAHAHFSVVLSRLMTVLLKKGFCKTEEQEEEEGEGDGEGGQKEGTGMDDGEGEKDVTNEMENEDQLMNEKDKEEQPDANEKDKNEEDNAADVETDFAGQKENREESEEDEGGEGEESDKEMGEIGEDDEVQDRKKMRREKDDREALEEDDRDKAEEVPQDELDEFGEKEDDETGGFENKEEELREAEEENEDEERKKEREIVGDENRSLQGSEVESDSDGTDKDASDESGEDREESVTDDEKSVDQNEEADEQREGSEERDKDEVDENKEAEGDEEVPLSDGDEGEDGEDGEDAMGDAPDKNVFDGGEQDDETGEEATEKRDKQERSQQKMDDNAGTNEEQANEQEEDDAGRNWKQQQEQNAQAQRKDNSERQRSEKSNPYKAMKEALQRQQREVPRQLNLNKQVKVQKDENEPEASSKPPNENSEGDDDDAFEFDKDGEKEGMAAAEEFVPPTTEENRDLSEEAVESEEDPSNEEDEDEPQDRRARRKKEGEVEMEEDEAMEDQSREKRKKKRGKPTAKPLPSESDEGESEGDHQEAVEEEEEDLDERLALGRRRWQEHDAAVQGLSQQLCEQLRLILAPTLADKLQGDYKTGKRLNMKRIIPYIASQFKKDRIWLRRTKPNKRMYQIMVALDDSLSMQCNGAGEFSCRAVTLMAKALQQLEVGEMGIVRFGADTEILHPLEEPFTAESGPRVMSGITFSQTSTKLGRFLETNLKYMDDARERMYGKTRSTTQELQQILYIFSDGQITEDREDIRKLMVRAEENHQMVVFVILDVKAGGGVENASSLDKTAAPASSPPLTSVDLKGLSTAERLRRLKADRESRLQRVQSQSILEMQLVEFKGGKVLRKGYMEEFPFPYYLIVRDMERLPEIIADSMRQWFELLNGH